MEDMTLCFIDGYDIVGKVAGLNEPHYKIVLTLKITTIKTLFEID